MLGELEPAFAVTVHKAQGSEYRAVILAALDGADMKLEDYQRSRWRQILKGAPPGAPNLIDNTES